MIKKIEIHPAHRNPVRFRLSEQEKTILIEAQVDGNWLRVSTHYTEADLAQAFLIGVSQLAECLGEDMIKETS